MKVRRTFQQSTNTFRHVKLCRNPSPERPWVGFGFWGGGAASPFPANKWAGGGALSSPVGSGHFRSAKWPLVYSVLKWEGSSQPPGCNTKVELYIGDHESWQKLEGLDPQSPPSIQCKEQCQVHADDKNHACAAWMDNIKTWTRLTMEESIRMAEDRDKWRKYVHEEEEVYLCKTHVQLTKEANYINAMVHIPITKNNDYKMFRVCKSGLTETRRACIVNWDHSVSDNKLTITQNVHDMSVGILIKK